jgi:bla regulator protein blaR1
MTNWILTQQCVLSFSLIILLIAEKNCMTVLGEKALYCLWLLVPLSLIVNNLPSDLVSIDNPVFYQYFVKVNAQSNKATEWLSWQIIWCTGLFLVVLIAFKAQWQIYRGQQTVIEHSSLPLILPKQLRVVESHNVHSPLVAGIWPATLILPTNFYHKFTVQQQQLILQHELVHYRRFDNFYNLVAITFVAVFWFNPLIWLSLAAFRRSQELACDAAVLNKKSQSEKISYSKALLLCVQDTVPTLSVYSQYGGKHPMLLRIKRIKNQTVVKKSSLITAFVAGVAMLTTVAMANQQGKAIDTAAVNEAKPIVRVEPKYPVEAAQQKIEGSVVLQFDIEPDGSTSNIKIIKAEPQDIFGKTSISALQKWKYKPQIVGGLPQTQHDILVQLDYRLDDKPSPTRSLIETVKILQ